MLDAPLLWPDVSRLIVDCNRDPGAPDLIVAESEGRAVPGNREVDEGSACAAWRRSTSLIIDAIEALLERPRWPPAAPPPWWPSIPLRRSISARPRPWDIGIVFDDDRRLSDPLIDGLERDPGLTVGVNEPYSPADRVYYTLTRHARPRGLAGGDDRDPERSHRRGGAARRRGPIASARSLLRCADGHGRGACGGVAAGRTDDGGGDAGADSRLRARRRRRELPSSAGSRCTCSSCSAAILLYSTASRLIFGVPVNWALEMSQFLLSAYYLLGGAYALQLGAHVRMDLFYDRLSARKRAHDRRHHHPLRDLLPGRPVLRAASPAPNTPSSTSRQNYSAWAPLLWPVKVVMTIGVFLMLLQCVSTFFKDIAIARGKPIA